MEAAAWPHAHCKWRVSHSPDLLSETQCHLVSSVLQFVLVALEVPEDLVHPNVQDDGSLLQAAQAKMTWISILKLISKNIMITYSLFHLWVLGNSNPYCPAKSITHQLLEVTNEQKEKWNSPPPPLPMKERKYLRSWQSWWTRRSLLKKETKKVISKHFTCTLSEEKKPQCCYLDSYALYPYWQGALSSSENSSSCYSASQICKKLFLHLSESLK